jgi:hypothetical protein
VLGRLFNVTGDAIDNRGAVNYTKRYPIHRRRRRSRSRTQRQRSWKRDQGHRSCLPIYKRRQSRRIWRRRRRQDCCHPGVDQQHRHETWRRFHLCRSRGTEPRRQ